MCVGLRLDLAALYPRAFVLTENLSPLAVCTAILESLQGQGAYSLGTKLLQGGSCVRMNALCGRSRLSFCNML